MKTRLFSTLVFALAIAFSVSVASDKGQKTTKKASTKKDAKSCCMDLKAAADCSDKDMKNCETKETKTTKSSSTKVESKEAKKAEVTGAELKKN